MDVLTGTSGFSYPAWKGRFYPSALPARRMLAHYATRLSTVEVNATFRRIPKPETLAGWAGQVAPGFVFALKAPQRITHVGRLRGTRAIVEALDRAAAALGAHRGPVLFQLPPTFAADVARLHEFLEELPPGMRAAFEFRHPSWHAEPVYATLADHGAALCIADSEERATPFVATAPFGYLRLRRAEYDDRDLDRWLEQIRSQRWSEALVFFKHEDEARGPELALRMRALLEGEVGASAPAPSPS